MECTEDGHGPHAKSALAASEQRRVDAEGALVTLRNETAKKGDRSRR